MNARQLIAWCALAPLAACTAPGTSLTVEHRRAMIDSVQHVVEAWRTAINRRDDRAVASFYANDPDFRWFEDGQLTFHSAREIGDSMKAMLGASSIISFTLTDPEVTPVAPGVAEVSAAFTERLTDSASRTIGFAGAVTLTAVHGDSGWKFLVGHTSLIPPPADTVPISLPRREKAALPIVHNH